jgi:16S rRNA (uracil1498-N3)-methyltransferase
MKKIHRFIVDQPLTGSTISLADSDVVHQIASVLRLKLGEQIVLCDGNGTDVLCRITEVSKKRVSVGVYERRPNTAEPTAQVTLYCAMLKRENFEFVVQKATEIGVSEIVPVRTERTVKLEVKQDRLRKIIREAAEQSGRGRLPVLHEPMSFADALIDAKRHGVNAFFEPTGTVAPQVFLTHPTGTVGAWVGPEGGWTDDEISNARHSGCRITQLGKSVLRAETAAVVAAFLAVNS